MLDAKVIVVGVAGVFLALGIAAAFLLGFGHLASAIGQAFSSGPISQAGDALSGYGVDIIIVLVILAIIVVIAFLRALFR